MYKYIEKIFISLIYIIPLLFTTTSFASPQTTANSTCLYYFYSAGCKHCATVKPFLSKMQLKHPNLKIVSFDTSKSKDKLNLLNQYFDAYQVSSNVKGVPIIFMSNLYLMGDDYIIKNLENVIINHPNATCPSLN